MKDTGKTLFLKWYCPNCANLVSGVIEYSGSINVRCRKCGVVMVMNQTARRKRTLTILVPDLDTDSSQYYI